MHENRGYRRPSNRPRNHRPLGEVDVDEDLIVEVRRHPFGLITMYTLSLVGLLLAFLFVGFLLPTVIEMTAQVTTLALAFIVVATTLTLLGLFVATYVYRESRLVVTNKNITQTIQYGLFSKKTSQLSMANVEDVTAEQHGLFSSLFNYGTVKIETAGEQANFHFIYAPYPDNVAKDILEAREKYIEHPAT